MSCQVTAYPDEGLTYKGDREWSMWVRETLKNAGGDDFYKKLINNRRGKKNSHWDSRDDLELMMKTLHNTNLPPLPMPLREITDHDTIRVCLQYMLEAEGFRKDWVPGDEPPASVVEWWGEEDHDIFKLYRGQQITAMTKLIRERHVEEEVNGIKYLKAKMIRCYLTRLGSEEALKLYHMRRNVEELKILLLEKEEIERREHISRAREERDADPRGQERRLNQARSQEVRSEEGQNQERQGARRQELIQERSQEARSQERSQESRSQETRSQEARSQEYRSQERSQEDRSQGRSQEGPRSQGLAMSDNDDEDEDDDEPAVNVSDEVLKGMLEAGLETLIL